MIRAPSVRDQIALSKPAAAHISDQAAAAIPAELKAKARWLVWRWHLPRGETKWKKPPVDPFTGQLAKAWRDPRNLVAFEEARRLSHELGDGLGYLLDEDEVAVDFDHCFDAKGNLKPKAKAQVDVLNSYTERSPRGDGLHVIVKGKKPTTKCHVAGVEVYDNDGNYLTFTGNHFEGTPTTIKHRQKALDSLYTEAGGIIPTVPTGGGNGSAQALPVDLSDDELLDRARNAKNGAQFSALFDDGKVPHLTDKGNPDNSKAHLDLMGRLAWYTNKDRARMERLFSSSAFGKDAKWQRERYRKLTLDRAIADCLGGYSAARRQSPNGSTPSTNGQGQPPPAKLKTSRDGDDSNPFGNEAIDDPHRLGRIYRAPLVGTKETAVVVFHQGEFHRWDGVAYRAMAEHDVGAQLTEVAKREFVRWNREEIGLWEERGKLDRKGRPCDRPQARKISRALIGNIEQALRGMSLVEKKVKPPAWLIDNPPFPPVDVLPMKNALVHLPSFVEGRPGAIQKPTPAFYCPYALDYDFDPRPPIPQAWIDFLVSVWPDDEHSINALQEWMGYLLTLDTRQQKIAFLIGPPRSGRGTIARLIKLMVGAENFAGPTLSGLANEFGAQCLIGKSVAIIADARISNRSDWAVVLERLLAISGEDHIEVNRKNLPTWSGILSTRLMLISNELPKLPDQSGALAARIILWRFLESFLGREDKTLDAKLRAELPGILVWSIEGWKRLRDRGYFLQPQSGKDLVDQMRDLSGPVGAWFRERCEKAAGASIDVEVAFLDWCAWCESRKKEPGDEQNFGRFLRAVLPALETTVRRGKGNEKSYVRVFQGFTLKPEEKAAF